MIPRLDRLLLAASLLSAGLSGVLGDGSTCSISSKCSGSSAPCCSEFGFCGTDNFCLGGCNPLASKDLTSCNPAPLCTSATYTFPTNDRILSNSTHYNGNSSAYDWVVDKGNVINTGKNGGEVALLLTKDNGGTRISSTKYMHYGTVTARMKTARTNGVVTAFITMSDVKDEIDWEWPGAKTTEAQSNFFWMGVIPDYSTTHGKTATGVSDTYSNYHDYTIDWQADQLQFLIDGNVVRTVTKDSTTNSAASGRAEYPSTPSRIQLSLWPAGITGSPQGTIDWAGGMIDWNDPDYAAQGGHFSMLLQSVTVKCAKDTVQGAGGVNATSYVYGANSTDGVPTVKITNQTTVNAAGRGMGVAGGFWMVGVIGASLAVGMTVFA